MINAWMRLTRFLKEFCMHIRVRVSTVEETFSLCYILHFSPLGLMYSLCDWRKFWLFINTSEKSWFISLFSCINAGNLGFNSIRDFLWLRHFLHSCVMPVFMHDNGGSRGMWSHLCGLVLAKKHLHQINLTLDLRAYSGFQVSNYLFKKKKILVQRRMSTLDLKALKVNGFQVSISSFEIQSNDVYSLDECQIRWSRSDECQIRWPRNTTLSPRLIIDGWVEVWCNFLIIIWEKHKFY